VKLSLAYAVGNPGKLQDTTKQRESLIFLGLRPWENRGELDVITDRMIAEKAAEEKLKAIEAKAVSSWSSRPRGQRTSGAAADGQVPRHRLHQPAFGQAH
jgi:hypothetical protein